MLSSLVLTYIETQGNDVGAGRKTNAYTYFSAFTSRVLAEATLLAKTNHTMKGKRTVLSNATYQSYLLRCWRDGPHGVWRASLQSTADNENFVFADINALFNFLIARLAIDDGDIATAAVESSTIANRD